MIAEAPTEPLTMMMLSGGPAHMVGSAVVGAVLLGLIEGVGLLINRYAGAAFRPVDPREAPQDPQQLQGQPQ